MSEELLKNIVRLFAIVAKERITEQERNNMREFLSVHLNQAAIGYFMNLFEEYVNEFKKASTGSENSQIDDETLEFLDEWSNIIKISKEVNRALTLTQKLVMVIKIIELLYSDGDISERQNNLIFYIGEALKIHRKNIISITNFVVGEDFEELSNENTLIIDDGSINSKYAGPHMVSANITGLLAVLRISDTETYFIKYLGISTLYLNGIALKSMKIDVFPTGSTVRGSKISTVYYSDVASRFIIQQQKAPLTFTAEHIFYHFKSGRAGLQNINIAERGGKLIGVMGASGSGKSTLLNVLNGTEIPSSGKVMINGVNIHEQVNASEGLIGYVPQDDFLIAELTVYENLYYAAKLCFKNNTKGQNDDLIKELLMNLGLSETAGLKVGSPMDKTISGGQRKRLNIALELMREPSILFVDEPTSGLSSRDSENIMDLLKELSFRGKMVFVVIHQPSSDIFKMFDTLLILDTGGFQIYYGNPSESISYFKNLINAANRNQVACAECGNINPEQVFNIIETKVVNEFGRLTSMRKVSPGQWYQYFKENITLPRIKHNTEPLSKIRKIPGRLKQFSTFLIRDIKSKLANHQYILINMLEAPILALFIAFMTRYHNVLNEGEAGYTFYENSNIPIYFFMSIIVSLFMGLTVSAEEIFRDRMILKRERFLNLSKLSYLTSKISVLFVISAIQTVTFVIIGDLVLDIHGMEPRFWLILFSTSCFANLLGLNISASFNSAVTIYILIPILLIPQLLLSGVVINFDKFNPKVSSNEVVPFFGDFMASRWAFEAAMVTQFKDNPIEAAFYEENSQMAESEFKTVYFFESLESELAYCLNNMNFKFSDKRESLENSLRLTKSELINEHQLFHQELPSWLENLDIQKFDSTVYYEALEGIKVLKKVYSNRYNKAAELKMAKIDSIEQLGQRFDSLIQRYQNAEIGYIVANSRTATRIIKGEDRLIRKIDPIYNHISPLYASTYRADFYTPYKYPFGIKIDTLYFNLIAIWAMVVLLFITLYFDVLKLILLSFSSDKRKRRYRSRKIT